MKTISLIGIALALCAPALASAQRGGGGAGAVSRGAIQRVDVQRVDRDRTLGPARDIDIRRGDIETGTRIPRRPLHNPARRRWYNATHPEARRRWNAANPPIPDPSRRRGGR